MSRVAKNPITLPKGVDVNVSESQIPVKGPKGNLALDLHPAGAFEIEEGACSVKWDSPRDVAMAGTFRALVNNMVVGVSEGF
ncbi:MAG: 50S ribosomal protein L6, partial [Gammaproteobacteria bacterium]